MGDMRVDKQEGCQYTLAFLGGDIKTLYQLIMC